MLRHDYFANRVFDKLDAAIEQAELGLRQPGNGCLLRGNPPEADRPF
jgi:hypothetical protein